MRGLSSDHRLESSGSRATSWAARSHDKFSVGPQGLTSYGTMVRLLERARALLVSLHARVRRDDRVIVRAGVMELSTLQAALRNAERNELSFFVGRHGE